MISPIRSTYVKADFQASRKSKIIENIAVYPIDKAVNRQRFDVSLWRSGLAKAAAAALENDRTVPYRPEGPFRVLVKMRDGEMVARKIAHRWKLDTDRMKYFYILATCMSCLCS